MSRSTGAFITTAPNLEGQPLRGNQPLSATLSTGLWTSELLGGIMASKLHGGAAMHTLYLVATPIGNLEDMTFRAVRVLTEASLIAAEDTRKTMRLLARYEIHTPLTSYYEHSKLAKLDRILAALETGDVALVSEAGMPGISDPGYELVCAALAAGFNVVPVPGASAPCWPWPPQDCPPTGFSISASCRDAARTAGACWSSSPDFPTPWWPSRRRTAWWPPWPTSWP